MQDKKDFNSTNGSKGKTQELIQKNPGKGKIFFSSPKRPNRLSEPRFLFNGHRVSFPEVKRPGHEVTPIYLTG
jgi:hypothetical protein